MLVIFNPVAGRRRAAALWKVLDLLVESGIKLEVAETQHAGHATELARTAARDGLEMVVAAGGRWVRPMCWLRNTSSPPHPGGWRVLWRTGARKRYGPAWRGSVGVSMCLYRWWDWGSTVPWCMDCSRY